MKAIKISDIKAIREQFDFTHLVIYGIDDNNMHQVATHGKSKKHANEAAILGNSLRSKLDWPSDKCNLKPLDRICENCDFWQRKKIEPGTPIPSPLAGKCFINPEAILRYDTDTACCEFAPNS